MTKINNSIFTDTQVQLIYKIHKYCRIFQLLNLRSSQFYKKIHSFFILLIGVSNVCIAIINFKNMDINPLLNTMLLLLNTCFMGCDFILTFQNKSEFFKQKSIFFNTLANDIESDLVLSNVRHLEFNRLLCRFKDLINCDDYSIPTYIINKVKKRIKFEHMELEEMVLIDPQDLNDEENSLCRQKSF
jgi:hypothetical protein